VGVGEEERSSRRERGEERTEGRTEEGRKEKQKRKPRKRKLDARKYAKAEEIFHLKTPSPTDRLNYYRQEGNAPSVTCRLITLSCVWKLQNISSGKGMCGCTKVV